MQLAQIIGIEPQLTYLTIPNEAAQLVGWGEELLETLQGRLPPLDRWSYERHVQMAREQLGAEGYAAANAAGRLFSSFQGETTVQTILTISREEVRGKHLLPA